MTPLQFSLIKQMLLGIFLILIGLAFLIIGTFVPQMLFASAIPFLAGIFIFIIALVDKSYKDKSE